MSGILCSRQNADRRHEREMASRYMIKEALEAIPDNDFGLSNGELSDKAMTSMDTSEEYLHNL